MSRKPKPSLAERQAAAASGRWPTVRKELAALDVWLAAQAELDDKRAQLRAGGPVTAPLPTVRTTELVALMVQVHDEAVAVAVQQVVRQWLQHWRYVVVVDSGGDFVPVRVNGQVPLFPSGSQSAQVAALDLAAEHGGTVTTFPVEFYPEDREAIYKRCEAARRARQEAREPARREPPPSAPASHDTSWWLILAMAIAIAVVAILGVAIARPA